jgi:hypothetical protein
MRTKTSPAQPEFVICDGPKRKPLGDILFFGKVYPTRLFGARSITIKFTPSAVASAPKRKDQKADEFPGYEFAWVGGFTLMDTMVKDPKWNRDTLEISSDDLQERFDAAHKDSQCFLVAKCPRCSRTKKLFEFGPPWEPHAKPDDGQVFVVPCECGRRIQGAWESFDLYRVELRPPALERGRS